MIELNQLHFFRGCRNGKALACKYNSSQFENFNYVLTMCDTYNTEVNPQKQGNNWKLRP